MAMTAEQGKSTCCAAANTARGVAGARSRSCSSSWRNPPPVQVAGGQRLLDGLKSGSLKLAFVLGQEPPRSGGRFYRDDPMEVVARAISWPAPGATSKR